MEEILLELREKAAKLNEICDKALASVRGVQLELERVINDLKDINNLDKETDNNETV